MRKEHDHFALAALMDMYACQGDAQDQWRNASAEVGAGNLEGALGLLEGIERGQLTPTKDTEVQGKESH